MNNLPVPSHKSHSIYDPSKIQSFQDCPRGFFYRYVLGWEKEEANVHLDFGSAWHEAMEILMLNGYTMDSVMKAYEAFEEIYREAFPDAENDISRAPKNPEFALKALVKYIEEWGEYDSKTKTLYTEVVGAVPVSANRVIHTKLDSIIRDEFGYIRSREHKTTGRNTEAWRNKWAITMQIYAYTHLLRSAFPDDPVYGVEVNGAVFTKSKVAEFIRIPLQLTDKNMRRFLWEVNHWLDQIEWNFSQLQEATAEEDVMHCFPINGASCGKFGCKFPGLCQSWDNPLQHCNQPPPGYEVNFWDPRRLEDRAKTIAKPEDGKVKLEQVKRKDD